MLNTTWKIKFKYIIIININNNVITFKKQLYFRNYFFLSKLYINKIYIKTEYLKNENKLYNKI